MGLNSALTGDLKRISALVSDVFMRVIENNVEEGRLTDSQIQVTIRSD